MVVRSDMLAEKRKLKNWEVAVYALYLCDGPVNRVHTEDVAIKCFELAPRSFSWLKHTEYPDKDIARLALSRARHNEVAKADTLVSGRCGRGLGRPTMTGRAREADGWRLTEDGATWVAKHEARIRAVFGAGIDTSRRQEHMRKLGKVRDHSLFQTFKEQRARFVPPIGPVADLLRCGVDAEASVWRWRFETLLGQTQLAEQEKVVEFLRVCEAVVLTDIGEEM